jgi:hypothetical protein
MTPGMDFNALAKTPRIRPAQVTDSNQQHRHEGAKKRHPTGDLAVRAQVARFLRWDSRCSKSELHHGA